MKRLFNTLLLVLSLSTLCLGETKHTFGWKSNPTHSKGLKQFVHAAPQVIAPVSDLRPKLPPVYDQKDKGSCTAQAGAAAFEATWKAVRGVFADVSRQGLYTCELIHDGNWPNDEGSSTASILLVLKNQGIGTEKCFPYSSPVSAKLPKCYLPDAAKRKLITAYDVDSTDGRSIRAALSDGLPVVFGGYVYNDIESLGPPYILPSPRGKSIGGHEMCMKPDTKIPLLNGQEATILELAQGKFGDQYWLYSVDKDGKIVPGLGHSARKTGESRQLVKVTLDDGATFECTPDHKIMIRDGSYVEAGQLIAGQSLMPLYRRAPQKGQMTGYEQVMNPSTKSWRWGTPNNHKVVSVEYMGTSDVYDLTVDEHHNFAISAGVFVHNCIVGHDDARQLYLVRNSWGTAYADLGYFYIRYKDMHNPKIYEDFAAFKATN